MRVDPLEGHPDASGTPEAASVAPVPSETNPVMPVATPAAPAAPAAPQASPGALDPDSIEPSDELALVEVPPAPEAPGEGQPPATDTRSGPSAARGAAEWMATICPYLRSADGSWRSTRPQRDHRCWARVPPVSLPVLTQARLCLTTSHDRCELYVDAVARHEQSLADDHIVTERLTTSRFGTAVRTTPLMMEPSTPPAGASEAVIARRMRMVVLGGAGAILLVLIWAALFGGGGGPTPTLTADASPSPASVASPTAAPSSSATSPTPGPTPSRQPTPVPSETVAPAPTPPIARTYKVKASDTLRRIARRFGVTVDQLLAVNDLGDPPTITPGQIINIPRPAPAP